MINTKLFTVVEVLAMLDREISVPVGRLLATARAAAEAGSLQAQLEEARRPLALLSQPEALRLEMLVRAEAALTVAQGEVAVLREALAFYADPETYHACAFLFDRPTGGFDEDFDDGHDSYDRPMPGKRARAALTSTRASADAYRESVRREALEELYALIEWNDAGTNGTPTGGWLDPKKFQALALTSKEQKPE